MRSANRRSKIKNQKSKIPRLRPGFTLIETLISLAIMTVLATALGSTIVLASRALDQDANSASSAVAGRRAADRMLAELNAAIGFTERTASSVTFTVPDRDGDGLAETIRYAWSGSAGDPLTRQYNNGLPDPVAEGVQRLDLAYLLRTVDPPPPKEVESAEMVLIRHEDAPGGVFKEKQIMQDRYGGAYFKPLLPAGALRWKITKIEFVARKPLIVSGSINLQVSYATASLKPGSSNLASVSMASSALPLISNWVPVSFSSLDALDPAKGVCFTVTTAASGTQALVMYEEYGAPMTPNTHWMTWADGWSGPQDISDMRIRVYGTVTTTPP